MRRSSTLLVVVASALLASAIGANARDLRFTSQSFRVTWSSITFRGPVGSITCPMTLEGTLHERTMAKTANNLLGYITRATLPSANCTRGSATLLPATLPWHVRYSRFTGTLPDLESLNVKVVGMGIQVPGPFSPCLFRSEATNPVILEMSRERSGILAGVRISGVSVILAECGQLTVESFPVGFLTVLNSAAQVTLTLI